MLHHGLHYYRRAIIRARFGSGSGAAIESLSQGISDVGLGDPELPSNSRGLDASLEGSTHGVQLSFRQTVGNFFNSCPPSRQLWFGLRLPFRQATTALGLGGQGGKQQVNLGIIQPHERSRQVLRQHVSGLGSLLLVRRKYCLRNNQRIGRPCWRRSRKQVWCLICRPADGHAPIMPPVPCHGNGLGIRVHHYLAHDKRSQSSRG